MNTRKYKLQQNNNVDDDKRLAREMQELRGEREGMIKELSELDSNINLSKKEHDIIVDKNNVIIADIDKNNSIKLSLEEDVRILESKKIELNNSIDELGNDYKNNLNIFDSKIKEQSSLFDEKEKSHIKTCDDLVVIISNKNKELEEIKNKIVNYSNELNELEQATQQKQLVLSNINSAKDSIDSELKILDVSISEKGDRIKELINELGTYVGKLEDMKSEIVSNNSILDAKKKEVEELDTQLIVKRRNLLSIINREDRINEVTPIIKSYCEKLSISIDI